MTVHPELSSHRLLNIPKKSPAEAELSNFIRINFRSYSGRERTTVHH